MLNARLPRARSTVLAFLSTVTSLFLSAGRSVAHVSSPFAALVWETKAQGKAQLFVLAIGEAAPAVHGETLPSLKRGAALIRTSQTSTALAQPCGSRRPDPSTRLPLLASRFVCAAIAAGGRRCEARASVRR